MGGLVPIPSPLLFAENPGKENEDDSSAENLGTENKDDASVIKGFSKDDYASCFFLFLLEIGIGVTGFGMLFLFLGMVLFFDRGLLAIGNVSR